MPNKIMKDNTEIISGISDATIASLTAKWGMGGGTLTSIFGWLSSNGAAIFIGIIITIFGFILNGVFQWMREKRAREEHNLKKKLLELELRKQQEEHEVRMNLLKQGIIPKEQ